MAYESLKAEIRQYIKTNGANEITGQILQNILIDMVNEYPSLSGYATQQWVENQEYLTAADMSQYATQSWVQQQGYITQQWVNNQHFIDYIGDVEADFNFADFHDLGGGVYQLHTNHTQTNKPIVYGVLVDFESQNGHMQLAASPDNKLYFRSYWWTLNPDGFTYTDWQAMATASQLGNYLPLSAGNTKPLTGNLYINTSGGGRSQLYLVSPTDVPNDLYFGSNGSNHWSITSRASTDGNCLVFYSTGASVGIGRAGFTAVVGYTTGIWDFALTPTVNGTSVSLNGHTHPYLPLAGGSLTGDLTFKSGNGISVYYQYGDPSDPEYDVILIKDGVVSVGNGGDITIGGNSVATQYWVGQNYLALSGGTMANGNLVTNMNADMLDGQHGNYYVSKNQFVTFDDVVPGFITSIEASSVPTAAKSPFIILGGNSCTIVQCLPGHPTYGAQLAFGFNSEYLIIRNRNNASTWSDWTKISAGYADSAGKATKDGNGNTITSTYLPLAGGSLTGDLTFQSGNGISVYYQYGDPSDPEYDVILIKDGVVSVGNGGDITIGGNSVATQSWVGQNYLALSGGTMANSNLVTNMNADLLDGFHSFGQTTPGLLYKYYQSFENSTTPSSDYVVKIVLDLNWWNKLTTLTLEASYSNRNGVLYLDLDSADDRWRCYHTAYNTNFISIKRVHNTTNGNTEIYIKLKKPTEYSGSTPKGDIKIWSPVQILSMSVVSGQDIPQDMITLYYGYNSNTPVNAGLSGWYLSNIVTTGYIQSSTANLQSYWCKVWDMTITSYQYNDIDITFLAASAFQGLEGIIHLKIRQNGATGAYNFEKYVKLLTGNIPLGRVKLYCNNTTGKCELWMNVNQQYGLFNVSILKKTLRYGNDRATLGTLYSTDFTTVQTPPSLTDTEIVTMTAYNSLVNAVKDGDGNTITSTYLKLAGGSLTGDLTFQSGNGISVYYQYGDPSDPEYDVILIKDGVVSVGNGGDITIGGNSVATQHWVGQNYLALSGGTVNGTLLVNGNLSSLSGLYAGNSSNAYYCSIINNGSLTSISSTDGNEHYEDIEIHADSVVFDTLGSVYGDFVNTSDSRLKTILADDILPTVEQVAGAPAIRYKWNELANKKNTEAHLGSIAQYWQPILPETVVQDNKGFLAMQYDVIALVSTIALARRITELEKELSEIKEQIKN